MIRINQLKLEVGHSEEELKQKVAKLLRQKTEIVEIKIIKQSIDARKKPLVYFIYSVDVTTKQEKEAELVEWLSNPQITISPQTLYEFKITGTKTAKTPPVVIGSGPAGLFCAYQLALYGYRPILLERGECVEDREKTVAKFWQTGELSKHSNVQFGEGGAGTFSDGKLNTLVKDKEGRNKEVLHIFVEAGASETILQESKPHLGTDVLMGIVKRMREKIIDCGGQVRFGTFVSDFLIEEEKITGLVLQDSEVLPCETVVLAIGHSARDTFGKLLERNVAMEAKSFAVGLRVEHLQQTINETQYGKEQAEKLSQASYKVVAKAADGRGIYSFCMCPGGYVVNASSEEGRLAINGMSYQSRDGKNANSAIIVSVTPEDFKEKGPLSGVAFQRELEEKAYQIGNGKIPVQLLGDFKRSNISKKEDLAYEPAVKGAYTFANVRDIMPETLNKAFLEGMEQFEKNIPGFASDKTLLLGVESRTSSPVRILRDETMQSRIRGLYPCGEGAGYAGGILSAAIDGIKAAEQIAANYLPFA